MANVLPPGVRYISVAALKLSVFVLGAHAFLQACRHHLPIPLPSFRTTYLAALALLFPIIIATRRIETLLVRIKASSRGAVLPPALTDPWPLNLATLRRAITIYYTEYLGQTFPVLGGHLGTIFSLQTGLSPVQYITTEPQHVKTVLATHFDDWVKGELFQDQMKSVLGTGVFNSDVERWKFHRAMTRPFFSKGRIADFENFDTHTADAISQVKERLESGYAIDIQDMFSRISLDCATAFLFNSDVRSLSAGLAYPPGTREAVSHNNSHKSNAFARSFLNAQERIAFRTFLGNMWPLGELFRDATAADMRVVNDYVEPIVAAVLEKKKQKQAVADRVEKDTENPEDMDSVDSSLLGYLASVTDDPAVIKDEALNIMVAGRDTVATTMTFAVYMLAEHPHILKRLRQEILDTVGPTQRPTSDDIKDMRYLRAFINETLRLYPAVPFDVRCAVRDTLLPPSTTGAPPYFVPKGAQCIYSVWLMQRRQDLWGPDAYKFDPDRFIDERVHKYLTPNPFIFLPFNAGPRICLGQQFAYNEISFIIIRLLQSFDSISLALDVQPPESLPPPEWKSCGGRKALEKVVPRHHLTLYCEGGLWVRMGVVGEGNK